MVPIYEQLGPYWIEYLMHIPLALIGIYLMYRAGTFTRPGTGGKGILGLVLFVCVLFAGGEAFWHFEFPRLFPLYESIL